MKDMDFCSLTEEVLVQYRQEARKFAYIYEAPRAKQCQNGVHKAYFTVSCWSAGKELPSKPETLQSIAMIWG